jgi:alanyl-tRNA synthetase
LIYKQHILDKFDLKEIHSNEELLDGVCKLLKTNKSGLLKKIDDLLVLKKDLEKRLKELKS